jgi:hypothetical protein
MSRIITYNDTEMKSGNITSLLARQTFNFLHGFDACFPVNQPPYWRGFFRRRIKVEVAPAYVCVYPRLLERNCTSSDETHVNIAKWIRVWVLENWLLNSPSLIFKLILIFCIILT